MTREKLLFANDPSAQSKGYVLAAYTKALPRPDNHVAALPAGDPWPADRAVMVVTRRAPRL